MVQIIGIKAIRVLSELERADKLCKSEICIDLDLGSSGTGTLKGSQGRTEGLTSFAGLSEHDERHGFNLDPG